MEGGKVAELPRGSRVAAWGKRKSHLGMIYLPAVVDIIVVGVSAGTGDGSPKINFRVLYRTAP
jgi:hypothetical protein